MEIPSAAKSLEEIYRRVDSKTTQYEELRGEEINEIIQENRRKKKGLQLRS